MDINTVKNKLHDFFKNYKYVILIVCLGLILFLIPTGKAAKSNVKTASTTQNLDTDSISDELADVLSHVKGAGKVKLYLMTAEGAEIIYQTNHEQTEDSSGKSMQEQTVLVTDSNRNEHGLIRKTNPPKYNGAIVVCEGADNAEVQLELIRAVSNVTGLGTNKISILKMK